MDYRGLDFGSGLSGLSNILEQGYKDRLALQKEQDTNQRTMAAQQMVDARTRQEKDLDRASREKIASDRLAASGATNAKNAALTDYFNTRSNVMLTDQADKAVKSVTGDKVIVGLDTSIGKINNGLERLYNPNGMTPQDFQDILQDFNGALRGGGGSLGTLQRSEYSPYETGLAKLKQDITGIAQTGSVPASIIERVRQLGEGVKETMQKHQYSRAVSLDRDTFTKNPLAAQQLKKKIGEYKPPMQALDGVNNLTDPGLMSALQAGIARNPYASIQQKQEWVNNALAAQAKKMQNNQAGQQAPQMVMPPNRPMPAPYGAPQARPQTFLPPQGSPQTFYQPQVNDQTDAAAMSAAMAPDPMAQEEEQ